MARAKRRHKVPKSKQKAQGSYISKCVHEGFEQKQCVAKSYAKYGKPVGKRASRPKRKKG